MRFKVCIVLVTIFLQSYALDDATKIEIDNLIQDFLMPAHRMPGVSIAVVQNGQVEMAKGYGFKNLLAGLEVDANTLFSIGSTTKGFVAILIVQTLSEMYPELGESVLDTPLEDLLPASANFTLIDRYRAEQASFRDLLSHRVCNENRGIDLIFGTLSTAAEFAYRSRFLPEVCQFRNGFEYNNAMLSLAGELVAEIAGSTFPKMMKNLWNQLGMINTTYIDREGTYKNLSDMSRPYIIRNGTIDEFDMDLIGRIHVGLGAGGILSTANDMAKYMNFHLNLGRVNNTQVVPEVVMRWLYRISNPVNFDGGRTQEQGSTVTGELGLAQGLMLALYDGWNVIHHGGYWPPFHCDMRFFPATKIGIYIASNGPGRITNFPLLTTTAYSIFDLILANSTKNASSVLESKRSWQQNEFVELEWGKEHKTTRNPTALESHQIRTEVRNEELLGIYGNAVDGDATVSFEIGTNNETLQINLGEFGIGRLHPIDGFPTTFEIEWKTSLMDHYYTYGYGEVVQEFYADFGIVDTFLLRIGTFEIYSEYAFERNATLETFPPIPWLPDSCGPRVV